MRPNQVRFPVSRSGKIFWFCILLLPCASAIERFGTKDRNIISLNHEAGIPNESPQFQSKPSRIVSANLGADQILLDLVPERMWSVSYLSLDPRLSHVADAAAKVPHQVKADSEQILALNPDLVVLGRISPAAVFSPIEESGVKVFRFTEYQSIEGVEKTIQELGLAVGEEGRATQLIETMRQRLLDVARKVESLPRPGVLYYNLGGFTGGQGTLVDSIIRGAGGDNLATGVGISGSKKLSMEYLLVMDPDVIVVMSPSRWYPKAEDEFLSHPAVRGLRAFREGKIFTLASRYLYAPSHHVVEAVEELARFIHPGAFGEVAEIHGSHSR